ncbi:Hypothetical predicted protein [Cloeon dipterum]|uniref:Uncharacterized protein n=1 Tax=Cloeon dipterum TaxID=197152 RepID=A0A8S1CKE8_9INSE|nr:Hypothetical predicted protein [Cloeon dipterum]
MHGGARPSHTASPARDPRRPPAHSTALPVPGESGMAGACPPTASLCLENLRGGACSITPRRRLSLRISCMAGACHTHLAVSQPSSLASPSPENSHGGACPSPAASLSSGEYAWRRLPITHGVALLRRICLAAPAHHPRRRSAPENMHGGACPSPTASLCSRESEWRRLPITYGVALLRRICMASPGHQARRHSAPEDLRSGACP